MIFRTHIANFCSGIDPKEYEVNTTDELLALNTVKDWKHHIIGGPIPFYQYSQSKHGSEYLLIAEYKKEEKHIWWVIGYLSEKPKLPEFIGD